MDVPKQGVFQQQRVALTFFRKPNHEGSVVLPHYTYAELLYSTLSERNIQKEHNNRSLLPYRGIALRQHFQLLEHQSKGAIQTTSSERFHYNPASRLLSSNAKNRHVAAFNRKGIVLFLAIYIR